MICGEENNFAMRNSGIQMFALSLALLAASACKDAGGALNIGGGSSLSTAKAQTAVNLAMQQRFTNWQTSGGIAQVQGVQLDGDGNGAQADLAFTNISENCSFSGAPYKYAWARGTAIFRHYTDGRWVLTKVHVEGEEYQMCGHGGWTGSISVS